MKLGWLVASGGLPAPEPSQFSETGVTRQLDGELAQTSGSPVIGQELVNAGRQRRDLFPPNAEREEALRAAITKPRDCDTVYRTSPVR
jgi:hypothetical protein